MTGAIASLLNLSPARRALLGAAVFAVLWTVIEVVMGARLLQSYNPLEVVWWRYAVHLAVLALLWGFSRPQAMVRTRRPMFHLVRSLLMVTMSGAFVLALYDGAPSEFMWSVFWTAPATIIFIAWWRLKERPAPLLLACSILGSLAAAMVYGHLRPPSPLAVACAVAMQLSFVLYYVMTRALHEERREANLFYTAVGPFVVLGAFMPFVWLQPNLHDIAIMTGIGVLGLVALYALDVACHNHPASVGAPGLFAHIPAVVILTRLGDDVHWGGRAAAGSICLVFVLAFAWIIMRAGPSVSRGEGSVA